jgi:hypothetical protein
VAAVYNPPSPDFPTLGGGPGVVPLPATLPLLVTALAGLALWRRTQHTKLGRGSARLQEAEQPAPGGR